MVLIFKKIGFLVISFLILMFMGVSVVSATCTLNSIVAPTSGGYVSGSAYSITFNTTEGTGGTCSSGAAIFEAWYIYDTDSDGFSDETWSTIDTISPGGDIASYSVTWNTTARTDANNSRYKVRITCNGGSCTGGPLYIDSNVSLTIGLDNTAPAISIDNDSATSWVTSDIINVTTSDAISLLETKYITTGTNSCGAGNDAALDSGTSGTSIIVDNDSTHNGTYICFRSKDSAGNKNYSISTQILYLDSTAPTVNAGVDQTVNATATLTGIASDTSSGIATYNWSQVSGPGTIVFNSSNTSITSANTTTDGSYVIIFTVTDNAGNSQNDTMTLIYDTTAPSYTINDGNATGPTQSDIINVTVTDLSLNVSSVLYGFSADSTCDVTDTYSTSFTSDVNFTIAGDNTTYLCLVASDNFSQTTYQLVGLMNTDNTNPVITVIEGNDTGPTQSDIINVNVTDTNLNTSSLEYGFSADSTCNISDTYSNSFSHNTNFTIVGDNTSYLCVKGADNASNIAYQLIGLMNTDNTAPVINITLPIASSSTNGSETINFTTDDVAIVECSLNNLNWTTCTTGVTRIDNLTNFSNLAQGTITLYLRSNDTAGNLGTDSHNLTKDTIVPALTTITLTSNNSNSSLAKAGNNVTLFFVANETIGTPTVTILGLTPDSLVNSAGNNWTAILSINSSHTQGAMTFTIDYTDLAGNAGNQGNSTTDSSSVTVDNTLPTLSLVKIFSNNTNSTYAKVGDNVSINFTTSETIGTPIVTILGGAASVSNSAGNNWTATRLVNSTNTEGTVTFTIDFSDSVGNSGTQVTNITDSSSVTLDRTVPVVTITSILTTDSTPALSGTFNDTNSVSLINVTIDGSSYSATIGIGTWTIVDNTISALTDGTYSVTVIATDPAGNQGTDSTSSEVTVDSQTTNTYAIEVSPNAPSVGDIVRLSAIITDSTVVQGASIYIDDTLYVNLSASDVVGGSFGTNNLTINYTLNTSNLSVGVHSIYIIGYDNAQWEVADVDNTLTFSVFEKFTITDLTSSHNVSTSSYNITVQTSSNASCSIVDVVDLTVNSSTTSKVNHTLAVTSETNGLHGYKVTCTNVDDNNVKETYVFIEVDASSYYNLDLGTFTSKRPAFLLARYQLQATTLANYNVSNVLTSGAGPTAEKLGTIDVNMVWAYNGSTWSSYNVTATTGDFTDFNATSISYYVLDLKTSGLGKAIRHDLVS